MERTPNSRAVETLVEALRVAQGEGFAALAAPALTFPVQAGRLDPDGFAGTGPVDLAAFARLVDRLAAEVR